MGLHDYRNTEIKDLSTGTRRLVELTALIGLGPKVLLLDEPSSGVAQRETEALGAIFRAVKAQLDLTLVIIEHDMPLVMGLSDRVIAMEAGQVIAEGSPSEIQQNPRVVESYLGNSSSVARLSGAGVES